MKHLKKFNEIRNTDMYLRQDITEILSDLDLTDYGKFRVAIQLDKIYIKKTFDRFNPNHYCGFKFEDISEQVLRLIDYLDSKAVIYEFSARFVGNAYDDMIKFNSNGLNKVQNNVKDLEEFVIKFNPYK